MSSAADDLTHLGILVLEPETGTPIARLPVYAEIALPAPTAAATPDPRFDGPLGAALQQELPACFDSAPCRERVLASLTAAIPETLPAAVRDSLANDPQSATDLLAEALRRAADVASPATLSDLTDAELARVIAEALKASAEEAGLITPGADMSPIMWAYPLGVMATDHAGYASFDLERLPDKTREALLKAIEQRRQDVDAPREVMALVYPTTRDGTRFDALAQGRFGDSQHPDHEPRAQRHG